MHTILHRINTIDLLEKTPSNFGVEIDIRSNGKSLILHHEPFEQGELFEELDKVVSSWDINFKCKGRRFRKSTSKADESI